MQPPGSPCCSRCSWRLRAAGCSAVAGTRPSTGRGSSPPSGTRPVRWSTTRGWSRR
ncbi:hypothetical protein [Ornithinimicrobium kibberense]|uniref:hypothetical protein n=1 Tax=Ornithinimicrobium kibberense TaxID=282060 RepID=UPI00360E268E